MHSSMNSGPKLPRLLAVFSVLALLILSSARTGIAAAADDQPVSLDVAALTRKVDKPAALDLASMALTPSDLEKAGYTLEARLRRSAIKDGQVIDQLLYGHVV